MKCDLTDKDWSKLNYLSDAIAVVANGSTLETIAHVAEGFQLSDSGVRVKDMMFDLAREHMSESREEYTARLYGWCCYELKRHECGQHPRSCDMGLRYALDFLKTGIEQVNRWR